MSSLALAYNPDKRVTCSELTTGRLCMFRDARLDWAKKAHAELDKYFNNSADRSGHIRIFRDGHLVAEAGHCDASPGEYARSFYLDTFFFALPVYKNFPGFVLHKGTDLYWIDVQPFNPEDVQRQKPTIDLYISSNNPDPDAAIENLRNTSPGNQLQGEHTVAWNDAEIRTGLMSCGIIEPEMWEEGSQEPWLFKHARLYRMRGLNFGGVNIRLCGMSSATPVPFVNANGAGSCRRNPRIKFIIDDLEQLYAQDFCQDESDDHPMDVEQQQQVTDNSQAHDAVLGLELLGNIQITDQDQDQQPESVAPVVVVVGVGAASEATAATVPNPAVTGNSGSRGQPSRSVPTIANVKRTWSEVEEANKAAERANKKAATMSLELLEALEQENQLLKQERASDKARIERQQREIEQMKKERAEQKALVADVLQQSEARERERQSKDAAYNKLKSEVKRLEQALVDQRRSLLEERATVVGEFQQLAAKFATNNQSSLAAAAAEEEQQQQPQVVEGIADMEVSLGLP